MGGGLNFMSKDQMSIPVTLLLLDDTDDGEAGGDGGGGLPPRRVDLLAAID